MFEVFKDTAGEWRWRLNAINGNTIADCAEGYRRRGAAVKGIAAVKKLVATAGIVEVLPLREKADG